MTIIMMMMMMMMMIIIIILITTIIIIILIITIIIRLRFPLLRKINPRRHSYFLTTSSTGVVLWPFR